MVSPLNYLADYAALLRSTVNELLFPAQGVRREALRTGEVGRNIEMVRTNTARTLRVRSGESLEFIGGLRRGWLGGMT